jgi:hypothetical protein
MLGVLDTNSNRAAGLKLPVPYIERALVNNGQIDIRLVLYIVLEEEQTAEYVTDTLSDVKFYVAQVFDNSVSISGSVNTKYTDTEYSGSGTSRFSSMTNYRNGIMDYLVDLTNSHKIYDTFAVNDTEYYIQRGHKILYSVDFTDFTFASEEFTEDSNKVIKFVSDITATTEVFETDSSDIDLSEEFYSIAKNLNLNMNLICFSSILDLSGMNTSLGNEFVEEARDNKRSLMLYNSFFSEPSYEEVFSNGILIKTPTTVYTLPNGRIFNGDVMQTIDGSFHGLRTDNFGREHILKRFLQLPIDQVSRNTIAPGTEGFTQALNGFTFILSAYGVTTELLPRLDVFRKSYIDKSTLTPAGRWYQEFNKALMATNFLLSKQTPVRPELVVTPVIVDNRSFEEDSYVAPTDLGYSMESDYIYASSDSIMMSRVGYFDRSLYGASVQPDEFENNYTLVENGFFFFDYEKAIKTQSVISKIFNIDKIENYFGKDVLNKYFKLDRVQMKRRNAADTSIVYTKTTTYDNSLDISYPKFVNTYYVNNNGTTNMAETEFEWGSMTDIYPELMLRNLDLVNNDEFENYRLMTFQFQDIMDSAGVYPDSQRDIDTIDFLVDCTDYTKQLYDLISGSFDEYLTGSFQEYVDAAEQFCSYNNIDQFFNSFFASAFEEAYSDDPESAPWIVAPVIYNLHKDLINNEFNGDSQSITDASIVISNQISPRTGNLYSLQSFRDNFESLREFYNSLDLSGYSNTRNLEFGPVRLLVSLLGDPDFTNLTTDLTAAGSDEADAEWLTAINTAWNHIKREIRAEFGDEYGNDESDPESGLSIYDVLYDIAAETQLAMVTIQEAEDAGEFDGLTPSQLADRITGLLAAAGVASAFYAVWGGIAVAYGVTAGFAAAFGPVGWIVTVFVGMAAIIAASFAALEENKRKSFRRRIEQILYDRLTELAASAQQINDSITVAMRSKTYPTDFKDIIEESFDQQPVLVYVAYMVLMVVYQEINPEYGEDIINSANQDIVPVNKALIESMAEFMASRALPSVTEYSEYLESLEDDEEEE